MKKYSKTQTKFNSLRSSFGARNLIPKFLINKLGINSRLIQNIIPENKVNHLAVYLSKYNLGNKLRNKIKDNISFIKNIRTYKGIRHKSNLPTREQRTHTNAKTSKKRKFKK